MGGQGLVRNASLEMASSFEMRARGSGRWRARWEGMWRPRRREREGQTATMQQEMEMEEARDARWNERRSMMR